MRQDRTFVSTHRIFPGFVCACSLSKAICRQLGVVPLAIVVTKYTCTVTLRARLTRRQQDKLDALVRASLTSERCGANDPSRLGAEIRASAIVTALEGSQTSGDTCTIIFKAFYCTEKDETA
jgi:hypothetical protein